MAQQDDLSLFLKPDILKSAAERGGDITRRFAMNKVGRMIAAALQDRTIRLYDVQNCEEVQKMEDDYLCTSIAFSPRGDVVATGTVDRVVKLWDIRTAECLATLEGHTYPILCLAFSPDGDQLVSGSGDTTLIIWDVDDYSKLKHLKGHSLYVKSCDWDPTGNRIVSGGVDAKLNVWDASSGELLSQLEEHRTAIQTVKFSMDGRMMVSGSSDHLIIIWDTSDKVKYDRVLQGHTGEVRAAAFSWDGKFLASGSGDKQIFVWSMDTFQREGESTTLSEVDGLEWYPDKHSFLSADGTGAIIRWDVMELESVLSPFKQLLQEIEGDSENKRRDELIQKFQSLQDQYDEEVLKDKRIFYILWQCKRALGLLKGKRVSY